MWTLKGETALFKKKTLKYTRYFLGKATIFTFIFPLFIVYNYTSYKNLYIIMIYQIIKINKGRIKIKMSASNQK